MYNDFCPHSTSKRLFRVAHSWKVVLPEKTPGMPILNLHIECWSAALAPWSALRRASAGKRELGSRPTYLNLGLPLTDGRRLEVVAHGLPAFGGVQVAVDVTLVSPLRRDGSCRSRADHEPGLALRTAAEHKHRETYPEFQRARRCRLTVPALEVGGRWGEETEAFLHRIAQGRALASPAAQRTAVAAAYMRPVVHAASLCQLPTDVGDRDLATGHGAECVRTFAVSQAPRLKRTSLSLPRASVAKAPKLIFQAAAHIAALVHRWSGFLTAAATQAFAGSKALTTLTR